MATYVKENRLFRTANILYLIQIKVDSILVCCIFKNLPECASIELYDFSVKY